MSNPNNPNNPNAKTLNGILNPALARNLVMPRLPIDPNTGQTFKVEDLRALIDAQEKDLQRNRASMVERLVLLDTAVERNAMLDKVVGMAMEYQKASTQGGVTNTTPHTVELMILISMAGVVGSIVAGFGIDAREIREINLPNIDTNLSRLAQDRIRFGL